jgi:hypothetical protein
MIEGKEEPEAKMNQEEGGHHESNKAEEMNNNDLRVKEEDEDMEEEEEMEEEERRRLGGFGMTPMETATLLLLSRIAMFNKVGFVQPTL